MRSYRCESCGGPEVLVDSIPSWGGDGNVYKTYHVKGCELEKKVQELLEKRVET